MILLQLFLTFAYICCFGFGGGYAFLPLMQQELITKLGWLTTEEFANIVIIAESTPGPIAVNTATYVGYKMAGIPGAIWATGGMIFPSMVIIVLLCSVFFKFRDKPLVKNALKGMKPVIAALIIGAALKLGMENLSSLLQLISCAVILIITLKTKIHPAILLLSFGALGLIIQF